MSDELRASTHHSSLRARLKSPEGAKWDSQGQRPWSRGRVRDEALKGRNKSHTSDVPRLSIPPFQGSEDLNYPLTRGVAPGFYMTPLRGFSNRLSLLITFLSTLRRRPRSRRQRGRRCR